MSGKSSFKSPVVSLRQATFGFVIVGAIIVGLAITSFAKSQRGAYQHSALKVAVQYRLQGAVVDLSRSLEEDWGRLGLVALALDSLDAALTKLRVAYGSDKKVEWAGAIEETGMNFVSLDGKRRDFSGQAWFATAFSTEVLSIVPDPGKESASLVMARPVMIGNNRSALVVVMSFTNLSQYLEASGKALGMDFFMLVPETRWIFSASDGLIKMLDLPSLRSASAGLPTAQQEVWPDGKTYFSSVASIDRSTLMPPSGLQVIGRMDLGEFAAGDVAWVKNIGKLGAVLLGMLLCLTLLYIRTFIDPFRVMSENAARLAEGHDEYPFESHKTRELAQFSAALARLIERKKRGDGT